MTPRRPGTPLPVRVRHGLGVAVRSVPFGVWFLGQMIAANWQVARDLVTPGQRTTPGVAAVPLRCRTRLEVTVLSNLITLTPGTLTVEVDRHGHVLYVLDIYAPPTPAGLRQQIHELEGRMLRMLRGVEPPAPPEGDGYGWSGRSDGPRPLSGSPVPPAGSSGRRVPRALRRRDRAARAAETAAPAKTATATAKTATETATATTASPTRSRRSDDQGGTP